MASIAGTDIHQEDRDTGSKTGPREAEILLQEVAAAFRTRERVTEVMQEIPSENSASSIEAKYRALLEQIPAVVFMAYIDRGTSEAYVSPEIEATLGYSRGDWLEDPARWYERIHPDDKQRWTLETAEMIVSGKPLRSFSPVLRNCHAVPSPFSTVHRAVLQPVASRLTAGFAAPTVQPIATSRP